MNDNNAGGSDGFNQQPGGIRKRELFLHCLMQWLSMQQELSEFKAQFHESKSHLKVKYLSGALSQVQIFAEFMFDVSSKDVKPLVFVFEAVKALLKFKEYSRLVKEENIKVYIDFETYKQLKEVQIYEKSLIKLVRSNKTLTKPPNEVMSTDLIALREKQRASKTIIQSPSQEPAPTKTLIDAITAFIARLVRTCSRFSPDEMIAILRPVVYMWSLIRSGVNSYKPIIISLLLDLAQLIIGIIRLRRSGEEGKSLSVVEKNEITQRIRTSFLKYLIREPIFSRMVKPGLEKLCGKLWIPSAFVGYFIAYINYYRYYSFIA